MVMNCCVPGCRSGAYRDCGISFRSFPKNEELRRAWLEAIRLKSCRKHYRVCSKHFVKDNAVPSLFLRADEGSAVTSIRDSVEERPLKKDADDPRPQKKEPTLSEEKKEHNNKSDIEKEVSANFTDIEKEILNTTTPIYEPVQLKVCCVPGCKSRSNKGDAKISYHRFPPRGANTVYLLDTSTEQRQVDQREAWRQLLRLEESPTDDMLVCSIHFKYQDFLDPETDKPSERTLHPQSVPIRCPPSYVGLRETILNEIRKERKLLSQMSRSTTDEEACALRVQQLASEWSDGEDSRAETGREGAAKPDEGFTQEEWLNDDWMSEGELDDEKENAVNNADIEDEPLEEEYLSDMDAWDEAPQRQPEATVNGAAQHEEAVKEEEEEDEELDGDEEEDMGLYDFGSSASITSTEDILDKLSIDLRAERPTIFLPLLGDAATRILSNELASVKRLVKETRARVHDARAVKNRQADEMVLLRRKIREMDHDRGRGYGLAEGGL